MERKTQLFYIPGGMTFRSHEDYMNFLKTRPISLEARVKWSDKFLDESLGKAVQIIRPRMPLKDNAEYEDWKIHFERYFNQLTDNIILIGESLGGIFLAKYLSENEFLKKILSTYLVAPPFDDTLEGEDLVGGFELQPDLSMIEGNCRDLTLLFSKNDDCVPVSHAEKYRAKLRNSNIVIYENKNGHFNVPEFPEIVEMIKKNLKGR